MVSGRMGCRRRRLDGPAQHLKGGPVSRGREVVQLTENISCYAKVSVSQSWVSPYFYLFMAM